METEQTTDTDHQPAEKSAAERALEDAGTYADLRAARVAGASWARAALQTLSRRIAFDEEDERAIRLVNTLTLSVGRIVDMEDRFANTDTRAERENDAARREIERLFALKDDEFLAVVDAARAARARAAARRDSPGPDAEDVERTQS
ncbi:MAG: hypothetical protein RIE56_09010 [Amphiplicatus sp.]